MDIRRPAYRVTVKPRLRWAAIAAFVLAAVVAPLAVGPAAAYADLASANATYRITTQASLAFDVAGASTDWGAEVIQWDVNSGHNQQWRLVPVGTTANEFKMVNRNSGQCLSIDASAANYYNGEKIIQFPCNGATTQNWIFRPVSIVNVAVEYSIAAASQPNYVIDIAGYSANLGLQLEIWQDRSVNGSQAMNQTFYLTYIYGA
jgi:hypothetical protein